MNVRNISIKLSNKSQNPIFYAFVKICVKIICLEKFVLKIDQANLSLSRLMCVSEKFESCKIISKDIVCSKICPKSSSGIVRTDFSSTGYENVMKI